MNLSFEFSVISFRNFNVILFLAYSSNEASNSTNGEEDGQGSINELTIPMRPNKLRPQKSQDNDNVCSDNSLESLAVKELLDG